MHRVNLRLERGELRVHTSTSAASLVPQLYSEGAAVGGGDDAAVLAILSVSSSIEGSGEGDLGVSLMVVDVQER